MPSACLTAGTPLAVRGGGGGGGGDGGVGELGADSELEERAGPGDLRGCNSIKGFWRDHKLMPQVSPFPWPFFFPPRVIYEPIILKRDCFLFHIIQIFS